MIDALISGRILRNPELKTGKSGKPYCNFLMQVPVDGENILVSAIAFSETAERIARLQNGDALSVSGSLKMSEWVGRDDEIKHGLNITVSAALSAYDVKKRRGNGNAKPTENTPQGEYPFNDAINF